MDNLIIKNIVGPRDAVAFFVFRKGDSARFETRLASSRVEIMLGQHSKILLGPFIPIGISGIHILTKLTGSPLKKNNKGMEKAVVGEGTS